MVVGSCWDNVIVVVSYIVEQGYGWFQSLDIVN